MSKIFNVDQLRVGGGILRADGAGQLFFKDVQLATGGSALPLETQITAGKGLSFNNGQDDTVFLSAESTFDVNFDDLSLTVDGSDKLIVKNGGIEGKHLNASVAGAGLAGGYVNGVGSPLSVGATAGGGIEVLSNSIGIAPEGVKNSMLYGEISNDKLLTITEVNKVYGDAILLEGSSLLKENHGLRINNQGVLPVHLSATVAGQGLVGGAGAALEVGVDSDGGLSVSADSVRIKNGGVTNVMLAGGITDNKLETISTANKVLGSAIELAVNGGLEDIDEVNRDGLQIKDKAIGRTRLDAVDVAGAGLEGTLAGALNVLVDAELEITAGNKVGIKDGGILNVMISDANTEDATKGISASKLQGGIPLSKTLLIAGDGLGLVGDSLKVNTEANKGVEIVDDKVVVDSTVVRTLSTVTQTLAGNYTFTNNVNFDSDIIVDGNLSVRGQTLVVNSTEVNIGDAIIMLNSDFSAGTPTEMAGVEIKRSYDGSSTKNTRIIFDETDDLWKLGQESKEAEILTFPRKVMDTDGLTTLYRGVFSTSRQLEVGRTRVYFAFDDIIAHDPVQVMVDGTLTHVPIKFHSVPVVVASLQNTSTEFFGGYTLEADGVTQTPINTATDTRSDLISCMVSQVDQLGFTVDFATKIPGTAAEEATSPPGLSDYFLNAYICSVGV